MLAIGRRLRPFLVGVAYRNLPAPVQQFKHRRAYFFHQYSDCRAKDYCYDYRQQKLHKTAYAVQWDYAVTYLVQEVYKKRCVDFVQEE